MTQFNLISLKLGVDFNLNICGLAKLSVANLLKKRLCIYIYIYHSSGKSDRGVGSGRSPDPGARSGRSPDLALNGISILKYD